MATSSVEICNSALVKIGAARISALSDNTKAAIACNDQYDRLRKEVLRSHPWNFAISYISLAATANTPVWDAWTKEFLLPSDVLRILETDLGDYNAWEIGYNVDGNKVLFCNDDAVKIKYIKDITNTTRFEPNFEEALAFRIAADLAYHLVQSQTVQANMFRLYKEYLATAMSFDAQEMSQQEVQADAWTTDVRG
tara:strand:- start:209 stop:793 length:585 start_codon:yes stop_codon:yes gene_type:complete